MDLPLTLALLTIIYLWLDSLLLKRMIRIAERKARGLSTMTNVTVATGTTGTAIYTEQQFLADLKKSRKKVDKMASQALKEHAEGKTEEWPKEA